MRTVGGCAFGYDHGSLGQLCTYESSLCEEFPQTPENSNRYSGPWPKPGQTLPNMVWVAVLSGFVVLRSVQIGGDREIE